MVQRKYYVHLKRSILFFCFLYFGLGNCPDSQADEGDLFKIFVPSILSQVPTVKRSVSGYVLYNGTGLEDVEIYEGGHLLAATNAQGYYNALLDFDSVYTLTPQKTGYEFTPSSLVIPGDIYAYSNQNFMAQQFSTVNISGKVLWKNYGYATIPSNPLPMVAVEAYSDDGNLYYRMVTGADGEYSISVPFGWKGCVKPTRLGFNLFPEKMCYYPLHEDHTQDYWAPGPGDNGYMIKVFLKKEDGTYLPSGTVFDITLDGIEYAQGSKYYTSILFHMGGECTFTIPSGWIGDITVSVPDLPYSYNPPFSRLTYPLNSDMEFTFIVY